MYFEKKIKEDYNDSGYNCQFESSIQEDNIYEIKKSFIERYKEKIREDSDIELYLKSFIILIIQCLFTIFFVWLGFATGISDAFIKSEGTIKGTLIPISIYILLLCYSALCLRYCYQWLILHVVTYVPCIVFYCYILTAVTDETNIYIVLFSIFLDILSIFIYILSFLSLNIIGLILFPLISNIIAMLFFSFKFLYNDPELIGKIIAIDASAIIYFNIIFFVLKGGLECIFSSIDFERNEYIFVAVIFDLAIFSPAAFVVFVIFVMLIIYGEKKKKKIPNF